jgi:uncharacterized protein (TIGR02996 family)
MPYANHPEWEAFRSAIVAEPDDDTVRLAAADWLDEHGDPDRAAFIRIQVELACFDPKSPDADRLRAKERAYLGPLSHFPGLWGATDCPQLVRVKPAPGRTSLSLEVTGANRVHFVRGFVETVNVPAIEWLHHGVAARERNPIYTAMLFDCEFVTPDQWYQMIGSGALIGLGNLLLDEVSGTTRDWLRGFLPGTNVDVAT